MTNSIPNLHGLNKKYLVFDLNGTLALDGVLIDGVAERLEKLRNQYQLYLLTADMYGTGKKISDELGMTLTCVETENEKNSKGDFILEIGPEDTIAIGAGSNDAKMLAIAAIGIAVLGPEGLANSAMLAADIIVPSIIEALDLLLVPKRLRATLK